MEVKNLNSIQQVAAATDYEALRQAREWDNLLKNATEETRTWQSTTNQTVLIRRKDGTEDYRFLPEPDVPPLILDESVLDGLSLPEFLAQRLPELPAAALARLQESYGLSNYQAHVIASDPPAIQFFDEVMTFTQGGRGGGGGDDEKQFAKIAANLLVNELFALVNEQQQHYHHLDTDFDSDDVSVRHSKVNAQQFGKIIIMLVNGTISSTMAKSLLERMYVDERYHGSDPEQVAQEGGYRLVSDPNTLRQICLQVIHDHPDKLELYQKGGKFVTKMLKLFTGKAMAASKGNAHPERLQEMLSEVLEEVSSQPRNDV